MEKNNDRRDINKAISAKMDNRARVILFGGEKNVLREQAKKNELRAENAEAIIEQLKKKGISIDCKTPAF